MASFSNAPAPTGILRRRSSVDSPSGKGGIAKIRDIERHLGSPTSRTGVHFEAPLNLSELLHRAASSDKNGPVNRKVEEELEGLVTHLRNAKGAGLVDWLQKIQTNVALLKPKMENFVLALLRIGWADQDIGVVNAYREFLINLITAQGYYTKPVMKMLLSNLSGVSDRSAFDDSQVSPAPENKNATLKGVEQLVFNNTHETINAILSVSPLAARSALLQYIRECQPYLLTQDTHLHTNYMKNILRVTEYIKSDDDARSAVLSVLIERLVQLDAHIDKNSEEEEDPYNLSDPNVSTSLEHLNQRIPPSVMAKSNLDSAMGVLLYYISTGSKQNKRDGNQTTTSKENHVDDIQIDIGFKPTASPNQMYRDLLRCFELHVLPAHETGHVQFALFYFISIHSEFAEQYLKWLWQKFVSPNTPQIIRQAAVAYMASFISRALSVSKTNLMTWLNKICSWIHAYIDQSWSSSNNAGSHAHGAFYAACQAVFYMFVFRQDEFKESKVALERLHKLGLQRIVTCHLNPLRVCLPTIVTNFSAVAKHFQLAYCDTIIHKNSRLHLPEVGAITSHTRDSGSAKPILLDTFFPFDPYMLPKSKHFISRYYREYHGNIEVDNEEDISSDEDEETMGEQDDSEDDTEEESDAKVRNRKRNLSFSFEKTPKRRRLSSSRSSISSSGVMDFGYALSPGFKIK